MLKIGDPRGFTLEVTGTAEAVTIQTPFATFVVRTERSITGDEEVWTKLTTREAFEVCLIRGKQTAPEIALMTKQRKENDKSVQKLPGGYLRGPIKSYLTEKILDDTGIHVEYQALNQLGQVIGHAEIHTPIALFWTTQWSEVQPPRDGVEIRFVGLEEALDLAMRNEVENDSSFAGIVRLHYLWQRGRIFFL